MDLHQKFLQLGTLRKNLTRQLQAILPEINKQEIFKKHGCKTIHEYAWKFAGFSKSLVDKIICTDKNLENKPFLKQAIQTQGIHKVALVATIATPETDKIFAKYAENMSKPALFEFAKELRSGHADKKCVAVNEKIKIELDDEMYKIFFQLKREFEKETKRDLCNKETMKLIFEKAGEKILKSDKKIGTQKVVIVSDEKAESQIETAASQERHEKDRVIKKLTFITQNECRSLNKNLVPENEISSVTKITRYIPAQQKRQVLAQYHNKCAYPNCEKSYKVFHHRDRFAISKNHESIVPFCKEHHEFAHNGLIKNELETTNKWKISEFAEKSKKVDQAKQTMIDALFWKYRGKATQNK